ncbi:hypothetical protein FW778_07420 [Ginsengibacter hankyongi]|uniref:Uncharacterized protein n=1 Tax=Ginsengibacter hankyongi TaxID=2607284 RepID=A0A5J5IPA2_9BACT|nr:hypothetical protein [Ginsengibacter hankyongi]KAA9041837.1 hypothetical protein FW778_07420 [Ginsengibacter hankyongi]
MKQIFTLLISLGAFATSFAQYSPRHKDDGYVYNESKRYGGNFSPRDKAFQVERINREYDFKINGIRKSWNLSRHQKKVAIRSLERERDRKIHMVNERFYERQRNYDHKWHDR